MIKQKINCWLEKIFELVLTEIHCGMLNIFSLPLALPVSIIMINKYLQHKENIKVWRIFDRCSAFFSTCFSAWKNYIYWNTTMEIYNSALPEWDFLMSRGNLPFWNKCIRKKETIKNKKSNNENLFLTNWLPSKSFKWWMQFSWGHWVAAWLDPKCEHLISLAWHSCCI